ncbi:DUF2199 domain-containing protein [Comamonas sp.]|uniref:DUF2199 domain-containing protein n=1 Tax=Comamonas sp. TaxID=34028 RepID=UPI0028B0DCD7|nr:DUF2199 domain-containing protein [Comamonas sp.]
MAFEFMCTSCGEMHQGMPSFGAEDPLSYYDVPNSERSTRCTLSSDTCTVDGKYFFVRGCIEIPIDGEIEPFSWGVWVSLSAESYRKWLEFEFSDKRSHIGPFFGWLNAELMPYPETMNLKTRVHLRDQGIRPFIELEPTDHPLAVEQRQGISVARVAEIYAMVMHERPA